MSARARSRATQSRAPQVKRTLVTVALIAGVTVGGVMLGALLVSTPATKLVPPRVVELSIAGLLLLAAAIVGAQAFRDQTKSAQRRVAPAPAMSLANASGRVDQTPRAVQALAQAGTAPVEIALRTRLPVDAVSMLLAMGSGARQA